MNSLDTGLDLSSRIAEAGDPACLAIVSSAHSVTYAELFERADALVEHLRRLGVTDGELIGVCLPRSVDLVVASLAILRAGGVYVALDPSWPAQRLQTLLGDAGVAFVISDVSTGLGMPDEHGVVRVAASGRVLESGLAYVMYTSGSTGRPKGVMVEEAGVLNLAAWHARAFGVQRGTRCSQLAGVGFDAAAWEIWGTLCAGGTLVIPPESVKVDPVGLRDWLVANRVEVAFVPTPLAEAAVRLNWPAKASLRHLLTGGDRLLAAPPAGLPFALVNNYGLTESSVVTTSGVVSAGVEGAPSVGAPIDGVSIRIVDADLTDTSEGELLVGGVSVARGYLGAPELTAERFVEVGNERWYRTGDRVRLNADGTLAFAGRLDEQVQIRGFRVEPAEIATAIAGYPGIVTATVQFVHGRLLAWVEGAFDEAGLRTRLNQLLPPYMVPEEFVRVDRMPLNGNGKVDVAALPLPVAEARVVEIAEDELTAKVAAIVARTLNRDAIGPEENFLLLGGHSLLGAQLVVRLSEEWDVEFELRALFDDPTPAGIAERIEELIIEQILTEQPA